MPIVRSKANTILSDLFQSTFYIGLSTTEPTATGGSISEPTSDTGYKRMPLKDVMSSASDGQIQNNEIIFFPESKKTWGTVTHFVIYNGKSGSPVFYGKLNGSGLTVPGPDSNGDGYCPIFRVGALKVGLDKESLS